MPHDAQSASRLQTTGVSRAGSAPGAPALALGLPALEPWLDALYGPLACGVVVSAATGEVLYANRAAEAIFGLSAEQMRGRVPEALWRAHREDGTPLPAGDWPSTVVLRTEQPVRGMTLAVTRPDGEQRWVQVDAVAAADDAGDRSYVVLSCVDVTARKQLEDALHRQAIYDALTALPNRNLFRDRVQQALQVAHRQNSPLALMIIDLDGFKEINDAMGHHWGDVLLQQVGQRLRRALRTLDTVARLGGDEFGVLLPLTDGSSACLVARKLQKALDHPFELRGHSIDVHASMGIALCPEHGDDAETLLRRADVAMYVAKRNRTGFATYSATDDPHTPTRLSLGSALRRAIHEQQLQLYYQPKVHYRTGTITSVEALVRWCHPELGLLEPDQFVALAEHTGLIVPLTQWVLNTALQQCREWQAAGLALGVAVNLSMRNLQDPGLLATITAALAATRLPPRYLTLELTETAFMADPDRALTVLTQLSEMGVSIAIDDFGTGYSSLGYLKRLPVHQIKIDKSFVLNMAAEKNDFTIVRSTIDLGHNLGLCVVAEGVEDHHTWNLLACLGCDGAQGYYISRPLPVTQLLHRLIESPWPPRTIDRADAPVPDAAAWGAN